MPHSHTDPGAVEYHLRRLDADARAALVADLWAARGFETSREDDVVVASRRGSSTRLYIPRTPLLGTPRAPDRPVDVVVVPRRKGSAVAAAPDAGVVDATDLREMLRYGVDRPVAVDLCERHLGAPPEALRRPLRERVDRRLRDADAVAPVVVGVVLLVTGALVASALAVPPADGGGTTDDTDVAPAPDPRPSPDPTPAGPGAVPGLNGSGVANVTALATAHARATADRSYTVWYDYEGPHWNYPDSDRVQRDVDMRVEGDRYVVVESVVRNGSETPVRREYYDGTRWYVVQTRNDTTRQWVVNGGKPTAVEDPFRLRRTLVVRFLSTPRTDVTGEVTRSGERHYRVVGSGRPVALAFERVENYTFVALVDERGLVRSVEVEYVRVEDGRRDPVRIEVTYDRVDTTTVGPPSWYERRFENATATASPTG